MKHRNLLLCGLALLMLFAGVRAEAKKKDRDIEFLHPATQLNFKWRCEGNLVGTLSAVGTVENMSDRDYSTVSFKVLAYKGSEKVDQADVYLGALPKGTRVKFRVAVANSDKKAEQLRIAYLLTL